MRARPRSACRTDAGRNARGHALTGRCRTSCSRTRSSVSSTRAVAHARVSGGGSRRGHLQCALRRRVFALGTATCPVWWPIVLAGGLLLGGPRAETRPRRGRGSLLTGLGEEHGPGGGRACTLALARGAAPPRRRAGDGGGISAAPGAARGRPGASRPAARRSATAGAPGVRERRDAQGRRPCSPRAPRVRRASRVDARREAGRPHAGQVSGTDPRRRPGDGVRDLGRRRRVRVRGAGGQPDASARRGGSHRGAPQLERRDRTCRAPGAARPHRLALGPALGDRAGRVSRARAQPDHRRRLGRAGGGGRDQRVGLPADARGAAAGASSSSTSGSE